MLGPSHPAVKRKDQTPIAKGKTRPRLQTPSARPRSVDSVGASVVITDRVRWYRHADYERSLDQIAPRCKAAPGHLDWNLVRPTPGVTDTYAVIIRFATTEHLRNWMESSERERLREKVQALVVGADNFYTSSGLDFWFSPLPARVQRRPSVESSP
jgi:antibiotic biosynthesis monooxygenase (ABM) superfamily enzyme